MQLLPLSWKALSRSRANLFLALLLLFLTGCTLLQGPQNPVIPTAEVTPAEISEAINYDVVESGQAPITGVSPTVDPDISLLLDAVSKQNLFAYVQTLQDFGTRHPLSPTDQQGYGVGAAAGWIFQEFQRVGSGRLEVAYQEFPYIYNGSNIPQRNVVATLPGVGGHPGVIILTAHYDSRGVNLDDGSAPAPGANDNASGVAVLLEAARLLSARSWNQTILFVALAAEEQGTFGARYFVQDKMLDGMIIDAVINSDMVGGRAGIPQAVRLFAEGPETSVHTQLARYIELVSGLYAPDFPIEVIGTLDRPGRYGDQREFVNAGIPAVRLIESVEDADVQHSSSDTAERLDYNYLAAVTRLNVAVAATMAGAPPPPATPAVGPMADAGAYLLSWTTDEQAAGYAIIFRPLGGEERTLRFIDRSEGGNVAITGMDSGVSYGISVASLDERGRISRFSEEVLTPEIVQE